MKQRRSNTHWIVGLRARYRFTFALAPALLAELIVPAHWSTGLHFLIGWDVGAVVYLSFAWAAITHSDAAMTRIHARTQDVGAYSIFLLVLAAALASTGAIAILLEGVKDLAFWPKTVHLALTAIALVSAWLLIHTIYAFHYARRFYSSREDPHSEPRGLAFPGKGDPDYFDFAYYSFVVGMTSQVSDVAIHRSYMRRLTLGHSVLSFFFNIAILALSINIIVSVI